MSDSITRMDFLSIDIMAKEHLWTEVIIWILVIKRMSMSN